MLDFGTEQRVAPGLTVDLVAVQDIDAELRAAWRDLDAVLQVPNPFFAQWFLEPALRHLDPDNRVRLCLVRGKDGALLGLMPITVEKGFAKLPLIHVAVWNHAHCYNSTPLMRRGHGAEAMGAWLDWMDTRPQGARFLRFAGLPYEEDMQAPLNDACAMAERHVRVQYAHERAVLKVGTDYDALMAEAMTGKKRKEVRRQARRFAELGEAQVIDLPTSRAAITDAVDDFIALEAAGWKGQADGGEPLAASLGEQLFFAEAMQAGVEEGAVSCLAMTLDTGMAAMLFCLRCDTHLSAFKTSYDEKYAAYSPGLRLIMEATRRMLNAPGVRMVDSCARPDHPVVDRLWSDRVQVVQVNIPTGHATDAALLDLATRLERSKLTVQKQFTKAAGLSAPQRAQASARDHKKGEQHV